ncbi:hypothetical protein BT047_RS22225 [Vibrio parahaemolyticus]|uniref:hypothetical protein n=1 Tax=Vibrio parahaemolyticus TaxID=670 RepID=UPI000543F9C1|nr:hypothetical protein [Vibrio parahaemolyticus]EGR2895027.1 hypothetical protein [Vibrio parahaemolyticus]EGR2933746.1 hypothetical protein [Vibrio parahaemolyticus]EGR2958394.1 hypothetical protein [Vibrio parahaemolyticus]EGR2963191.1 hypothetical protein [Vibrio parahaemolyticus]EGR2968024.1 hypothetical protein [Vibrio parahaemolyticus]
MARQHKFPVPQDSKIGNPTIIVPKEKVLALYNQSNLSNSRQNYCEAVKNWFLEQALGRYGWSAGYPSGCGGGINLVYKGNTLPPLANHPSHNLLE